MCGTENRQNIPNQLESDWREKETKETTKNERTESKR